jgi:hypothetical protein
MANKSDHRPAAVEAADGSHREASQPAKPKGAIWRWTDANNQAQEVPLAEIIGDLEHDLPRQKAILPALSRAASANINAAGERCDALIAEARAEDNKLRAAAKLEGDWHKARTLRQGARDSFQAAQSAAAVRFLDAQAQEYLPLTGAHFSYETLPVLAATSLDLYGKGGPGCETVVPMAVKQAVENREREWRARWCETQASAADVTPKKETPIRPGGRHKGTAVDADKLREYRGGFSQEDFAGKCEVSPDSIQRGEEGGRWDDKTFAKVAQYISDAHPDRPKVRPEDLKQRPQKPQ